MMNEGLRRPAPGWLAPGVRVYAVGDVHGCAARLSALHRLIASDLAADSPDKAHLVHIGDYIDRGPDSAHVVTALASGPVLPNVAVVNLRGNHEQMLLDALSGKPGMIDQWIGNGAEATLRSWGTSARRPVREWRDAIGTKCLAFLRRLPLFHAIDGYLFVHAGVQPGLALARQTDEDLLWIRDAFLDWDGPLLPEWPEVAIVHGHTPEPQPTITPRRIGIDTGAVRGGALTCAVLEERTVRFLSA